MHTALSGRGSCRQGNDPPCAKIDSEDKSVFNVNFVSFSNTSFDLARDSNRTVAAEFFRKRCSEFRATPTPHRTQPMRKQVRVLERRSKGNIEHVRTGVRVCVFVVGVREKVQN